MQLKDCRLIEIASSEFVLLFYSVTLNFTRLTLLNLQEAFDTVSHNILLAKLKHYAVREPVQSCLKRLQFVGVNGTN